LEASTCFLNENLTKLHKILLVRKPNFVHIEVIDDQPLPCGDVNYKTALSKVMFNGYSSIIVFNVIKIPSYFNILGISWLKKYNPSID